MDFGTRLDAQIQQAVLRELGSDGRVHVSQVIVAVQRGVVTLSGMASSWSEKLAAQEVVHRIEGVLDIVNDVEVGSSSVVPDEDTEIARAIRAALSRDVVVPANQIQCTVWPGIVTLEGEVSFWSERERAERAARNVAGVRQLRNLIRVRPSRVAHDVRTAIDDAIARHAQREARNVDVEVCDGVVVLSGHVQSWGEKRMLVGAAKSTSGVRWVDDQLEIVG